MNNQNLGMEKILYPRFLIVKDDFYLNPDEVYKTALQAHYYEPELVTGFRSRHVYHPKGIKARLEKILV